MVGLETVQSHTKQSQVPGPQRLEEKTEDILAPTLSLKGAGGPDAQVDSEIQRWKQGQLQAPAGIKQQDGPKSNVKLKTQLVHVGVKEFSSRGKGRHFGYIITGSE